MRQVQAQPQRRVVAYAGALALLMGGAFLLGGALSLPDTPVTLTALNKMNNNQGANGVEEVGVRRGGGALMTSGSFKMMSSGAIGAWCGRLCVRDAVQA